MRGLGLVGFGYRPLKQTLDHFKKKKKKLLRERAKLAGSQKYLKPEWLP